MKTRRRWPSYQVFTPEGLPHYQAQTFAAAKAVAVQSAQILDCWPLPHVNGASSPLFTIRRVYL